MGENCDAEIPASPSQDQLDFFSYILRNCGVLFEALQELEHIGRSRDEIGIRVGFHFYFDGSNWLPAPIHYPR